jgi:glutathione S-transferase
MLVFRFDELSRPYYALRRGDEGARERLDGALSTLDAVLQVRPFLSGLEFGLADIAYVPWILRARDRMDVDLEQFLRLSEWVSRLVERPSIGAELDVVASS